MCHRFIDERLLHSAFHLFLSRLNEVKSAPGIKDIFFLNKMFCKDGGTFGLNPFQMCTCGFAAGMDNVWEDQPGPTGPLSPFDLRGVEETLATLIHVL